MKIRNEQIDAMSRTLGTDFRPRLAECLGRLPRLDGGTAQEAIDFCLTAAKHYQLETERELAALAIALCSAPGGFTRSIPPEAETLLRDFRRKPDERIESLLEWAAVPEEIAGMAAAFGDRPAAEPVAAVERPSSNDWVAIELIDEADWPVAGEEYCVTLPSGALARGYLDRSGKALLSGLRSAQGCKLGFPDLDRDVWERIP